MQYSLKLFILCLSLIFTYCAQAEDDYAKTKYPIVFVHGFSGSTHILFSDYFFGITEDLRDAGATVYTPALPAINTTEVRTKVLLAFLQELQRNEGYQKFNLIAHSHGGLSARQIAAEHPELVASVTTVATPHKGSYPSDAELENPSFFLNLAHVAVGFSSNLLDGKLYAQNKRGYLESTSTQGVRAFNQKYPAGVPDACGEGSVLENGIYQYSMSGTKVVTNIFDPSDWYLFIQSGLTQAASDGWIARCSSHFGRVLRDNFEWNHLDEINQLFGLRGGVHNPITVYRNHANRLKNLGL